MAALQRADIQEQYEGLPIDHVVHGDCLSVLKNFPDNSVDAICCDPPAGIEFMGREWDSFKDDNRSKGWAVAYDGEKNGKVENNGFYTKMRPSFYSQGKKERDNFISFMTSVMAECLRVIKPGGHALVWSLPRTSHWTGMALEGAGWEIRDCITHIQGQGFPKSHNLGNGRGTALKPACEFWWLCRKPLSEKNIAENVLKWDGCGALNIDQCRVTLDGIEHHRTAGSGAIGTANGIYSSSKDPINRIQQEREQQGLNPRYDPSGRFPSNLVMSHDPRCIARGTKRVRANGPACTTGSASTSNDYGKYQKRSDVSHRDEHGLEEVQAFECHPFCPVRVLGDQAGESKSKSAPRGGTSPNPMSWGEKRKDGDKIAGHEDEGSKARYFQQFHDPLSSLEAPFHYFSKSSRRDRNSGLEGMPESSTPKGGAGKRLTVGGGKDVALPRANTHPTCKPTSLISWLCTLITPPGGIILDPFFGSGTLGVCAVRNGFHFIGIEQEQEYVHIARARIAHAQQESMREESEGQEYICVEECPIKVLEKQSKGTRAERSSGGHQRHNTGNGHGFIANGNECESSGYDDSKGGASRYFQQFPPEPVSLWDEEVAE